MDTCDDEIIAVLKKVQEWHGRQTALLNTILEHKEADIELGELTITAGSDVAKGVRIGIRLALNFMGKLPFSIQQVDEKEECGACGADDYDGELNRCPHCESTKCSHCDMGDNVPSAHCEGND